MTHINLIVNSLPRDLLEFVFFLAVGFTAGSVGLILIYLIRIFLAFDAKPNFRQDKLFSNSQ